MPILSCLPAEQRTRYLCGTHKTEWISDLRVREIRPRSLIDVIHAHTHAILSW